MPARAPHWHVTGCAEPAPPPSLAAGPHLSVHAHMVKLPLCQARELRQQCGPCLLCRRTSLGSRTTLDSLLGNVSWEAQCRQWATRLGWGGRGLEKAVSAVAALPCAMRLQCIHVHVPNAAGQSGHALPSSHPHTAHIESTTSQAGRPQHPATTGQATCGPWWSQPQCPACPPQGLCCCPAVHPCPT
ncbi:hypothetical protein HaLaN_12993 [Haematococcus lacustris]|uniref:Uncharacterized protein n=1 Tax=Haematococcus lacustris TaxID=44745 RepID=A0A699Z4R1_HAELA|nr:hypothetical protein HaLaN_12992 [Haematococcus lacustris]GFH16555.1 hypothetical protein HaLaN_12993 [Haematococcus lacustris]